MLDPEVHKIIIKLIIAYTFVGALIFTVVVTLASVVGWIKFADKSQQQKLFYVFVVELGTGSIALFFNFLEFSPKQAQREVQKPLVAENQALTAEAAKLQQQTLTLAADKQRLVAQLSERTSKSDQLMAVISQGKAQQSDLQQHVADLEEQLQKATSMTGAPAGANEEAARYKQQIDELNAFIGSLEDQNKSLKKKLGYPVPPEPTITPIPQLQGDQPLPQ